MNELPLTRQSLLIRLGEKSDDAWSEFLQVYERAIYDFSRRRGLQDADAQDVTQDVLSAVQKKIASWKDDPREGKFRGWLFRVARNIAVDKFVEQSRLAVSGGDTQIADMLAEFPESPEEQSAVFWIEYRRRLMHWAAEKVRPSFKESSWRSFWMTAIEGKKPEEVASELGVTIGSVYAAKFRIVTRIRKIVSRLDDDDFESDFDGMEQK